MMYYISNNHIDRRLKSNLKYPHTHTQTHHKTYPLDNHKANSSNHKTTELNFFTRTFN